MRKNTLARMKSHHFLKKISETSHLQHSLDPFEPKFRHTNQNKMAMPLLNKSNLGLFVPVCGELRPKVFGDRK